VDRNRLHREGHLGKGLPHESLASFAAKEATPCVVISVSAAHAHARSVGTTRQEYRTVKLKLVLASAVSDPVQAQRFEADSVRILYETLQQMPAGTYRLWAWIGLWWMPVCHMVTYPAMSTIRLSSSTANAWMRLENLKQAWDERDDESWDVPGLTTERFRHSE
jgi:hypothetical protein